MNGFFPDARTGATAKVEVTTMARVIAAKNVLECLRDCGPRLFSSTPQRLLPVTLPAIFYTVEFLTDLLNIKK